MRHDTNTMHAFTCKILKCIKKNLHAINKVLYFSAGAASQYKNFKNFKNLCCHEIDHGIKLNSISLQQTMESHPPCDKIGTTKQLFVRTSLQSY